MLMKLTLLKSKIHRATVTAASLHYEGSLTISADLAALVQLREYEKILVVICATASASKRMSSTAAREKAQFS
jgi:aspartate 1-decarboxylase